MTTIMDILVKQNPLLGHGPRTHDTGVVLAKDTAPAPRRPHARWDVDAPRVHLGHAGRTF